MRAGELKYRITLEQRADTQDAAGQPIPAWTTLAVVWSSYEPAKGREFFINSGLTFAEPALFRIRYRSDVTPKHRVSYGGKVYDIRACPSDGDYTMTMLYCDTGLTQG